MTDEQKNKLKEIPRSKCAQCGKSRYYTNPIAKCDMCKNKFCYDHIYTLQINDRMKENEPVKDICEKCREEHGYSTLK